MTEHKNSPQDSANASKQTTTRELPGHYIEAEEYFRTDLLPNDDWFKQYRGEFVAIIGRQVVDSDRDFQLLSRRVRPRYGYGSIFMPLVSRKVEVVYVRPRISIL